MNYDTYVIAAFIDRGDTGGDINPATCKIDGIRWNALFPDSF